ncbi:MAG: winged helix-turn-helix domain-containing protein [Acidimicrobiales bacterium]|nr:winged helix-turn-helix domain-containing protein [Acidimicrobiales bacterium]
MTMRPEVCIEHRYPAALVFLRQHGPQALAVLHDLLARAEVEDSRLVARGSTRDIAARLEFLSKDSVHRRLRQLARAGVIEPVAAQPENTFTTPTYVIHLDDSGITVATSDIPA